MIFLYLGIGFIIIEVITIILLCNKNKKLEEKRIYAPSFIYIEKGKIKKTSNPSPFSIIALVY